jgi:hypothetical protein
VVNALKYAKAVTGNCLILGFLTGSNRPISAGHDRPLYGKQFCDMEFGCLLGTDRRQLQVNGCLTLKAVIQRAPVIGSHITIPIRKNFF